MMDNTMKEAINGLGDYMIDFLGEMGQLKEAMNFIEVTLLDGEITASQASGIANLIKTKLYSLEDMGFMVQAQVADIEKMYNGEAPCHVSNLKKSEPKAKYSV